ncbi:hypothetical protein [Brevundimonas sp.]|jgi:antitoxin VapB|uniref:hypothetical protein n=1 Tax=Brevundimonas sp. TaxID=1871086 RepID=UPI0037C04BE2
MDGSQPVRITRDGDHQVIHLPSGVSAPAGAVVRQEGGRLIIEAAGPQMGSVERLLAVLATMEPIDEEIGEIDDPLPEPVDL